MGACKSCGAGEEDSTEFQVPITCPPVDLGSTEQAKNLWLGDTVSLTPAPSDLPTLSDLSGEVQPPPAKPASPTSTAPLPASPKSTSPNSAALRPASMKIEAPKAMPGEQEPDKAVWLASSPCANSPRKDEAQRPISPRKVAFGEAVATAVVAKKHIICDRAISISPKGSQKGDEVVARAMPVSVTKSSFAALCTYEYVAPVAPQSSKALDLVDPMPVRSTKLDVEAVVAAGGKTAHGMQEAVSNECSAGQAWNHRPSVGTWLQLVAPRASAPITVDCLSCSAKVEEVETPSKLNSEVPQERTDFVAAAEKVTEAQGCVTTRAEDFCKLSVKALPEASLSGSTIAEESCSSPVGSLVDEAFDIPSGFAEAKDAAEVCSIAERPEVCSIAERPFVTLPSVGTWLIAAHPDWE